jgi:hypothetical protein
VAGGYDSSPSAGNTYNRDWHIRHGHPERVFNYPRDLPGRSRDTTLRRGELSTDRIAGKLGSGNARYRNENNCRDGPRAVRVA